MLKLTGEVGTISIIFDGNRIRYSFLLGREDDDALRRGIKHDTSVCDFHIYVHQLSGTVPFDKILLHPMVRDKTGRKMSKSLGNVMDPLHVIHGATLERLLDEVKVRISARRNQWMLTPFLSDSKGISSNKSVSLLRKLYVKNFQADFRSVELTHYV